MSGLEALYQQLILDHSKTPHGQGFVAVKAPGEGESHQYNPVCGDEVRSVFFADNSLEYCPTCQTGGKLLADRRLSRLLK